MGTDVNIHSIQFHQRLTWDQGTQDITLVQGALGPSYWKQDGAGQMTHFVNDDGFSAFRLAVGWQYLVNNVTVPTGILDPTNARLYDVLVSLSMYPSRADNIRLVQECLVTGAHCVIDIHNYARWSEFSFSTRRHF